MERNVSNDIDWNALPDNANWVAMDKDGEWWWYEKEPSKRSDHWQPEDYAGNLGEFYSFPCDDWAKSLQSRPSPSAAIPSDPWDNRELGCSDKHVGVVDESDLSDIKAKAHRTTKILKSSTTVELRLSYDELERVICAALGFPESSLFEWQYGGDYDVDGLVIEYTEESN